MLVLFELKLKLLVFLVIFIFRIFPPLYVVLKGDNFKFTQKLHTSTKLKSYKCQTTSIQFQSLETKSKKAMDFVALYFPIHEIQGGGLRREY